MNTSTNRPRARLAVETLEDRVNPVFLQPGMLPGPQGVAPPGGGLSIAAGDLYPDNALNLTVIGLFNIPLAENEYVVGFGPGVEAQVLIFGRTGNLRGSFTPFPGFTGGVNVAVGDVIGDEANEIIVTPATNGFPVVAVFTPQGQLLSAFLAFTPLYTGGLNLAVGNVADGVGAGGYNGGFTQFTGVGTGGGFQDFKQEIIVGTAALSSRVLVTDGVGNVKRDFFAFDPLYTGGVTLATGSVDKSRDPNYFFFANMDDTNAYDEIIVGAASFAPAVRIYSAWEGGINLEQSYFAYPANIGLGVNVGAGSSNGLRGAEIYANLIGTSVIRTFDGITQERLGEVQVYPPQFSRIVNFVVGNFDPSGGGYVPFDDELYFALTQPPAGLPFPPPPFFLEGGNPDFVSQDLAVVSGNGPFFQVPRFFQNAFLSPAPFNGP